MLVQCEVNALVGPPDDYKLYWHQSEYASVYVLISFYWNYRIKGKATNVYFLFLPICLFVMFLQKYVCSLMITNYTGTSQNI